MRSLVEGNGSIGVDVPLLRKRYGILLVGSLHLLDFGYMVGAFEGSGCDGHLPPSSH
jgi:hypothetical protein